MSELRSTLSDLRDDVKKQLESSHATAIEVVRLQGTIDRVVDRVVEMESIREEISEMKKKDEQHTLAVYELRQDVSYLKKLVYGAVSIVLTAFVVALVVSIGWKS